MSKIKVKVTLIEDILGTLPADPEIYKSYIASKAPDARTITEEIEAVGQEELYNKGMTVFPRDISTEDKLPFLYNYVVKGFFKNACSAMRDADNSLSADLKAYKKKIDNNVFVFPRKIKLIGEDGNPITNDQVTVCERPLRASTPQGDRVAIAVSESIPASTWLEFEVETLNSDLDSLVIEWLDYGKYNGLGQWHNSGKGSFTYEILEVNGVAGATIEKKKKKATRKKKSDETTDTEEATE